MNEAARGHLEPWRLSLRYGRKYQWLRRAFLSFSLLWVFALPLWHLKNLIAQSAGLAARSPFSGWAEALPWPRWTLGTGAPASLSFFGLDFIDPMFSASVWTSHGAQAGLWVAALLGVVLVISLGRFFCGWACPYLPVLAVSNATRRLADKLGVTLPDLRLPRAVAYAVLALMLVGSAVAGVQWAPLLYPPSVIGREVFQALVFGGLSGASLWVAGAFVFDTFVSRAGFCRTVCPGGAMFSLLAVASPLRVVNERSKCTDCTACDVICNLGQKPMSNQLDAGCERCGRCIAVCPTQALAFKLAKPVLFKP